jgi:pimeloyl-ACP methyl ester carboxylesterase
MEMVRVGDIEMACEISGEGRPLVMIQGLTATMDWWDEGLLEALSRRYRVLTFDNRGAGRTVAPDGEFSIEQFADDTAGLMDELGIESASVLGYSMGGMIAQELALRYPERVEKLILCVTFCGGSRTVVATREVMQKLVDRSGSVDDQVERFVGLMFTPEWIAANRETIEDFKKRYMIAPTTDHNAARQFMATLTFDAYDRLPGITAPTLVVCGADDVLIPSENSRIIAGAIPGARLLAYEGSGHGFVWQRRAEFALEIEEFLG